MKKRVFNIKIAITLILFSGILITVYKNQHSSLNTEHGSIRFDFGVEKNASEEGWIPITVESSRSDGDSADQYHYSKEKGYGFTGTDKVNGISEEPFLENSPYPENIYTDHVVATGKEFVVDLNNGTYTVELMVGSDGSNQTVAKVENEKEVTIRFTPGEVGVQTLTDVVVKDGQLNIVFGDKKTDKNLVSAIVISQMGSPSKLKAELNFEKGKTKLTWKKAKGSNSYNIYRINRLGEKELIGTTEKTTYVDKNIETGDVYTYFVTAACITGTESSETNRVEIEVIDSTVKAPGKVSNLSVSELTDSSITLSWDKTKDADWYDVYWSDRECNPVEGLEGYQLLGRTKDTTSVLNTSTHLQKYFIVIAGNDGGYSELVNIASDIGKDLNPQTEALDRGLVAIMTENGVYISFRISMEEYGENATYEIYRDGVKIKDIAAAENSNYLDKDGKASSTYMVKQVSNGLVINESADVVPQTASYLDIPLQIPKATASMPDGSSYTYSANDMSAGDVNGDGVYELFVKWTPSNAQDNSKAGYTGPTIIDCYTMAGDLLWRVDLGINIRSGAHYTQYMVYDFDGDGSSEMICKTADGSKDGAGTVIGDASADYRNSGGYILTGPEYLTLFDGETGKALDTIDYNPQRGSVSSWGDDYGNRVDRFLAGVAYLDGSHPSAVFARGYYTRAVVVAYDVVNNKLVERWVCDSNDTENKELYGQGAHSFSSADVDVDGYHEIVYGSAVIDEDGTVMYSMGSKDGVHGGHGDALHVGDFNLTNPGLEIFMVHETYPHDAGIELHDGDTGEYLYSIPSNSDVGRGAAGDIDPEYPGCESWAIGTDTWNSKTGYLMSADGEQIASTIPAANHMIWWDSDLGREILDHNFSESLGAGTPVILKWNWNTNTSETLLKAEGTLSNNYTKGNPGLQADLFGDWREEVVFRSTDSSFARVYMTTDLCDYRIYTLMDDIQYRCAVAGQNSGYNQPPHTSFYIGFDQLFMEVPVR